MPMNTNCSRMMNAFVASSFCLISLFSSGEDWAYEQKTTLFERLNEINQRLNLYGETPFGVISEKTVLRAMFVEPSNQSQNEGGYAALAVITVDANEGYKARYVVARGQDAPFESEVPLEVQTVKEISVSCKELIIWKAPSRFEILTNSLLPTPSVWTIETHFEGETRVAISFDLYRNELESKSGAIPNRRITLDFFERIFSAFPRQMATESDVNFIKRNSFDSKE